MRTPASLRSQSINFLTEFLLQPFLFLHPFRARTSCRVPASSRPALVKFSLPGVFGQPIRIDLTHFHCIPKKWSPLYSLPPVSQYLFLDRDASYSFGVFGNGDTSWPNCKIGNRDPKLPTRKPGTRESNWPNYYVGNSYLNQA